MTFEAHTAVHRTEHTTVFERAQLEELEDKETAATSVVLNPDGTVTFGATDGPLPTSITGTWIMVSTFLTTVSIITDSNSFFVYSEW
jgi:hypothetical protein